MDYRFKISKPDSSDFRCEIAINGDQTFQQFHDKIVETLGFDGSQMASFFALDKLGNRGREIALMEMSLGDDDEENNTLVMDVTTIREVVNASCIELDYVYDFFSNNYLRVEYAGEYVGDSADVLPLCVYCEGPLPHQSSYDVNEDWEFDKDEDDEYDDSFMEEFGGTSSGRRGRRKNDDDDEDYRFGDEDDEYGSDSYDEDGGYDERFESLDDYIDKL